MSRATWTPDASNPSVFAELSGDYNPVHLDSEHAKAAGFPSVIVHGMCVLGASARAAHLFAPEGSVLREIDVRFANPVLPDQTVAFEGTTKEKDGSLKVGIDARLVDDTRIMQPANFIFGPADGSWDLPRGVDPAPHDKDVVGDEFRFDAASIDRYCGITAPSSVVDGEGVPPMVALLGMTGALEKAFSDVEPERPGTWVHLRQRGVFYAAVEEGRDYVCRIQSDQTVVRTAPVGAQVTIPFVVETVADTSLVATGACVLFYAFDREDA